jgi:hypothetical protein
MIHEESRQGAVPFARYTDDLVIHFGFTFRPRHAKNHKGQYSVSFSPAISRKAASLIRDTIRGWKIHTRTGSELADPGVAPRHGAHVL